MNKKDLKKLKEVVENNYKWPLILEGVTPDYFPSGVIVEGDIDSSKLESFETVNGEKIPAWLTALNISSKKYDRALLIINGIDEVDKNEQEKFMYILKGSSTCTLPENTQILLTVKDAEKVSAKIKQLCIIYKVEN